MSNFNKEELLAKEEADIRSIAQELGIELKNNEEKEDIIYRILDEQAIRSINDRSSEPKKRTRIAATKKEAQKRRPSPPRTPQQPKPHRPHHLHRPHRLKKPRPPKRPSPAADVPANSRRKKQRRPKKPLSLRLHRNPSRNPNPPLPPHWHRLHWPRTTRTKAPTSSSLKTCPSRAIPSTTNLATASSAT